MCAKAMVYINTLNCNQLLIVISPFLVYFRQREKYKPHAPTCATLHTYNSSYVEKCLFVNKIIYFSLFSCNFKKIKYNNKLIYIGVNNISKICLFF